MRHQTPVRGLLGVALLLLVGGVALVVHARQDATASVPGAVCPSPSSGATPLPTPVVGIAPRNDCTPSFTERDVRAYVANNDNLGVNMRYFTSLGQSEIVSVRYLTVHELAGIPPVAPSVRPFSTALVVCYVVLRGGFLLNGPPGAPRTTVNSAFILFDAHIGSFLTAGAFQQP